MLSLTDFCHLLSHPSVMGRKLNPQQEACVLADVQEPLMVVAGPGSGKTTVMVARALRLLLVEGIAPECIVVTTFTKKAAAEIRTRWLLWGRALLPLARSHSSLVADSEAARFLDRVDLNRCITGTLDSLCEKILADNRDPLEIPAVLVEQFAADQLLLRSGLKKIWDENKEILNPYLATFGFEGAEPRTSRDLVDVVRPIFERFCFDQVNLEKYALDNANGHGAARSLLVNAFHQYRRTMEENGQLDFAGLEHKFLARLQSGALGAAIGPWRAILVDEYQDSNALQEAIYFECCRRSNASLTVVGDDDQSLYRFRGATVELFARFVPRVLDALGKEVRVVPLVDNYRSTPEIVEYYNNYVLNDPGFGSARVIPPKPPVVHTRPATGLPVLGMFRPTKQDLAADVAQFIQEVFRGDGFRIGNDRLIGAPQGGDVGDAVLLCSSVAEWKEGRGQDAPKPRLPNLLRTALAPGGIGIFNPRGQALRDQASVRTLLGLLLECLDPSSPARPDGRLTPDTYPTTIGLRHLCQFRFDAKRFIASNPPPNAPHSLQDYVVAWNNQSSQTISTWPDEWPLLELVFTLISWMPQFLDDPEHQVWLEAILRTMSQAAVFSPYRSTLIRDGVHRDRSRSSAIRDVLRPIAEDLIDVDEDLITHYPRSRLNIMTIHQSKGLEFPLVIADVSSDYTSNHAKHAFKRFPKRASSVTEMENDLAAHCEVGGARAARSALDRSFDDLVRQYYVAYSRPQTCLLLVGLEASLGGKNPVKSVATNWRRDDTWPWRTKVGRSLPPVANNLPFTLI